MSTRHYFALAVVWTLGVLGALFLPTPGQGPELVAGADKVVHAVLFGGLGIFWMRATRRPVLGVGPASLSRRTLAVLAGCSLLAVLTEVGQHWLVPSRQGDPLDLAADLAGLVLAVTAYRVRGERAVGSEA